MSALDKLKKHLRPGRVYRRSDLLPWSNAVDRHLKQLVDEGTLSKQAGGLYYCPKQTSSGAAQPEEEKLIGAFLKDNRFLLTSPNAYDTLGVDSTQLTNKAIVYNHKRHGHFRIGNREYDFRMKPHFPRSNSEVFVLVDLVDNMNRFAELKETLLKSVKMRSLEVDRLSLAEAVRKYGGVKAKKFFQPLLKNDQSA
jgi:hypothetical protein